MTPRGSLCLIAVQALSLGAGGCGDDGIELSVDVSTDLVPGVEFASVAVSLPDLEITTRREAREENFFEPQRIADFDGLAADSERRLRVALLDASGSLVLAREATVNHRGDLAVTITLSRDCRGVACDSAAAFACLGGRCVDPECVTGTEPSCPEVECRTDDACPEMAACARARCVETLCLYAPVDGLCATDQYCVAESGCAPLPAAPDAGTDTSTADASTLPAPQVLWPPNGYRSGSESVQFRTALVDGATEYEFEFDPTCPGAGFLTCPFSGTTETYRGTAPQTFRGLNSFSPSGPAGVRYAWRARSCIDSGCGEWGAPRYLDVGRYGRDFDGDGRDELYVGAEGEFFIYTVSPDGTLGASRRRPTPFGDGMAGFGRSAHTGDFNADGYIDLVVGAPDAGATGAVVIFAGGPDGISTTPRISLPPSGARFRGQYGALMCAGDFNADGYADLAVGNDDGSYILLGTPTGLEATVANLPGIFPQSCADVDADGFADIVSGAAVALGGTDGFASETLATPLRAYLGDLNGDAFPDFVTAHPSMANLVFGAIDTPVGRVAAVGAGHDALVYQVSAASDLDDDGMHDAVIAWPGETSSTEGFPSIVFGGTTSAVLVATLCGRCRQGTAVVNGLHLGDDAFADAVIGAPDGNRVYILYGRETRSSILVTEVLPPSAEVGSFGQSL